MLEPDQITFVLEFLRELYITAMVTRGQAMETPQGGSDVSR
jgi:hypothetical protein